MPSPPRIIFPKTVVFVTTRTEQGLPLVCHPYMEAILWGILARAQHLYPVKVCHFVIMGNHVHFMLLAEEPTDVVNFIDRVKTETAHAINRLQGNVGRRTVWCDSYDCVPVLTVADVIDKIRYIYTNPAQSDLVESIAEYPGVSSWQMYESGKYHKEAKWINRSLIRRSLKRLELWQHEPYAQQLLKKSKETHSFVLTPDAWKEAFPRGEIEEVDIIKLVKQDESELKAKRVEAKKSVLGKGRLRAQRISQEFVPKKFGKRMWCICRNVERRIGFIVYIKRLRREAREVVQRWSRGDFSMPFPLGLFAPKPKAYANRMAGYL